MRSVILRLRAAAHEIRCRECRVTWASLFGRIFNIKSSWTPTTGEG